MVDALLDTAIVVDLLRKHPPAQNWFNSTNLHLGVTKFVWLEIIQGAASRARQKDAVNLLGAFTTVPIMVADVDWALDRLTRVILAHNGLDMKDSLIAATSARLQVPLYTRNLKHMRVLIGGLAQAPY